MSQKEYKISVTEAPLLLKGKIPTTDVDDKEYRAPNLPKIEGKLVIIRNHIVCARNTMFICTKKCIKQKYE